MDMTAYKAIKRVETQNKKRENKRLTYRIQEILEKFTKDIKN